MKWQPIETAPNDETPILLWWPEWASRAVIGCVGMIGARVIAGAMRVPDSPGNPTHWMPLPTAPSTSICLICGSKEDCGSDACTFDPTPKQLHDDNCRLRAENKAMRKLVRDLYEGSQPGSAVHEAAMLDAGRLIRSGDVPSYLLAASTTDEQKNAGET